MWNTTQALCKIYESLHFARESAKIHKLDFCSMIEEITLSALRKNHYWATDIWVANNYPR